MNLQEFQAIKVDLTAKMAAAMSKVLQDMGAEIDMIDWISYRPLMDAQSLKMAA